jgi:hypothetical protein
MDTDMIGNRFSFICVYPCSSVDKISSYAAKAVGTLTGANASRS